MTVSWFLPLLVAVAATAASGVAQSYRRPRFATWSMAIASVLAAGAAVAGLVMALIGFAHAAPSLSHAVAWCFDPMHHRNRTPWLPGGLAFGWLILAGRRMAACRREHHRLAPDRPSPEVTVVQSTDLAAYTLPGPNGSIVVSQGMLDTLDEDERRVLFAHERSHLRRRHDRFIYAIDLSRAVVPFLGPLTRSIRFATERWADEDAAAQVGDRSLVARAIARAALAQHSSAHPGMALAVTGVSVRIDHLLDEPPSLLRLRIRMAVPITLAFVAVGGSGLQFHHVAMVAQQVCEWT